MAFVAEQVIKALVNQSNQQIRLQVQLAVLSYVWKISWLTEDGVRRRASLIYGNVVEALEKNDVGTLSAYVDHDSLLPFFTERGRHPGCFGGGAVPASELRAAVTSFSLFVDPDEISLSRLLINPEEDDDNSTTLHLAAEVSFTHGGGGNQMLHPMHDYLPGDIARRYSWCFRTKVGSVVGTDCKVIGKRPDPGMMPDCIMHNLTYADQFKLRSEHTPRDWIVFGMREEVGIDMS